MRKSIKWIVPFAMLGVAAACGPTNEAPATPEPTDNSPLDDGPEREQPGTEPEVDPDTDPQDDPVMDPVTAG